MLRTDVFLMGGGLKGAYQYGFFKRLYAIHPSAPIDRVFGASVGAVNAPPVVLRRMDVLDEYWSDPRGSHPFKKIMLPHSSVSDILRKRSIYRSIRTNAFESFWSTLSSLEKRDLSRNLHIISFDPVARVPVIHRSFDTKSGFSSALAASTRFPGLVSAGDAASEDYIDGVFADPKDIVGHIQSTASSSTGRRMSQILVLDITTDSNKSARITNPYTLNSSTSTRIITYRPQAPPSLSSTFCAKFDLLSVCASRRDIDHFIANGADDADDFFRNHSCLGQVY
jgi:hypothetical protein